MAGEVTANISDIIQTTFAFPEGNERERSSKNSA